MSAIHIKRPIMLFIASFMMPFIIIVVAIIGLRITPFGDNTLLISDANALYVNYLGYVGRLLRGMEGVTYTFEKGLGGNMMPHMAGTMSNPVFALIALFRVSDYPIAFTLISTISLSICGLTMYILLADLFGHRLSNLIFSTSYALSGFLVANVFQVIFFTGPMVLPLVVLGLRKLLQGKNPLLYILSLTFSLATNAYFGFTQCVLSVLLFFTYLWGKKEELAGRKLSLFVHYAISSLCGGLLAICIWLPGFMGMMGGRLDQTKITDFSFWEKMPFLEIFSKLFTGANTTSQLVNGLPNIFVGILPVFLAVLFFTNKLISKRLKIGVGVLLGFYLCGFYIIAFDMLLHGGTNTNWFNFRYSYIFSFLLLLVAAYEWQYVDELTFLDLKHCFIGFLIAVLLIFSKKYEYVMGSAVLLDFVLLFVIFGAYWLYKTKPEQNPKRTFEAVVLLIISIGLYLNYTICTKNILDWQMKESDYQNTVNMVSPLLEGIQKADQDFYRMEVNKQRSGTCGNDPMLYGYNGVGHGGSNERNFVREELSKLGVQWYNMRNYYAQGIPAATDALLGIRYLIANEDVTEEKAYLRMTDMASMGLASGDEVYDAFKSNYALPIAFVAENGINELELDHTDLFDNLNRVWQSISDTDQQVFIEENEISFRSINHVDPVQMESDEVRAIVEKYDKKSESESGSVSGESSIGSGSTQSTDDGLTIHLIQDEMPMFASAVEFTFTATQSGPVYVYHRAALVEGNGNTESVVKYMGTYQKGDTVTGYLPVQGDHVNRVTFEEYAGRFRAAYADLDALQELSAIVTARPSTIEKIKDSHLKGTMTLEEGQELLFTIPWDAGWTCYVDGQKVELTKVLGIFMAAQAAPGEHTYEMKYMPGGMSIGIKISIGALILLILYMAIGRKLIDKIEFKRKNDSSEANNGEKIIAEIIDTVSVADAKEEVIPNDSV